jgi:hypothetical protein
MSTIAIGFALRPKLSTKYPGSKRLRDGKKNYPRRSPEGRSEKLHYLKGIRP